jgi:hypothetical protein
LRPENGGLTNNKEAGVLPVGVYPVVSGITALMAANNFGETLMQI